VDLTRLQNTFITSWIFFLGDFNAVMGAHEKRGHYLPPSISCNDFLTWTNANLLLHLNTNGIQFTSNNGRLNLDYVFLRLNCAICNEAWTYFWGYYFLHSSGVNSLRSPCSIIELGFLSYQKAALF